VLAHQRPEVLCEFDKTRIYLAEKIKRASVEIVIPAFKRNRYAVIEDWSPWGHTELTLSQPGEKHIAGRVGMAEIAFIANTLAVGDKQAINYVRLTECKTYGVTLVAAVTEVLLPLARDAIHDMFDGAIEIGIDGGIEYTLEKGIRAPDIGAMFQW